MKNPSADGRDGTPHVMRILVVEDNADCAESMALVLRLAGHQATVAPDGPTALQAAAEWQPDVILLDIRMPGMDGWEVARWLKERQGGKPPLIVAVTGFGSEEDRRRSREAGIDLHLLKPVEPDQLREFLSKFHRIIAW